jgi:hypothetical protein
MNGRELKQITKSRLKSAQILIKAKDWEMAAYMMGYTLECALKAAICRRLGVTKYPDSSKTKEVANFFRTHKFIPLLLLSGLSEVFSFSGNVVVFQNWSNFTKEYPGEWPTMRYKSGTGLDEIKVKNLYTNLTVKSVGVLSVIKKRW